MRNFVCHLEIPVTDLDKAKEFYSKVFGWEIQVMLDMGYATFQPDTPPGGGFAKVDKIKPGGITFYIMVNEIEKKLVEIENAGGKKESEITEIPNIGWEVKFSDPFGNILGLFRGRQEQG